MRAVRRFLGIGVALVLMAVMVPAVAYAIPADAEVVSTRTESVSGYEIATQAIKDLDHVALGPNGATFSLDVDGAAHDVSLDLGDLVPGGGGTGGGLGGIAIIGAIAAGIFKGATFLLRLMS